MAKSCGCHKRVISNVIKNMKCGDTCCDVCVTPQCGSPDMLTVLAPVVYDEIGINVCRTFALPETLLSDFPTAAYAGVEVINLANTTTATPITIVPINSRPYCYEVTLTNLTATFAVRLYDCCKRLLTTATVTDILYLPASETDPSYNPETNPSAVTLELFAPYGVTYTDGNISSPALSFIGFSTTNSTLNQGLNLIAVPKVLDFDIAAATLTVGLTLVVKTVYFTQYLIPHNGRPVISKGILSSDEDSACVAFVEGSLLDRNIKPLEACNPFDQKLPCNSCSDPDDCACLTGDV